MPTWNADQYLKFTDERSRPGRELAARIQIQSARRVIDLGCGPGNSTQILAERWPAAEVRGIDSSAQMIGAAARAIPGARFSVGDIATWSSEAGESFDVVFSNAAMQWVEDHATVLPRLLGRVTRGGALAVQVPSNFDAPAHQLMRQLAASEPWRHRLPPGSVHEWHVHEPAFYYDVLSPHAGRLDLWETEYLHVIAGHEAIVEWYKGTGLRPFLDPLPAEEREQFAGDYLALVRSAYPMRADGKVLFPFRRLFVIAYAPVQVGKASPQ